MSSKDLERLTNVISEYEDILHQENEMIDNYEFGSVGDLLETKRVCSSKISEMMSCIMSQEINSSDEMLRNLLKTLKNQVLNNINKIEKALSAHDKVIGEIKTKLERNFTSSYSSKGRNSYTTKSYNIQELF
jgi:hypothetical protein